MEVRHASIWMVLSLVATSACGGSQSREPASVVAEAGCVGRSFDVVGHGRFPHRGRGIPPLHLHVAAADTVVVSFFWHTVSPSGCWRLNGAPHHGDPFAQLGWTYRVGARTEPDAAGGWRLYFDYPFGREVLVGTMSEDCERIDAETLHYVTSAWNEPTAGPPPQVVWEDCTREHMDPECPGCLDEMIEIEVMESTADGTP